MNQYKESDINHKLIIHLRDLSHTMQRLYEGRGSQKRVLIILGEASGTMTQRELTARLGIQPGSASEIIAKLENTGFIIRSANEKDRRTSDITLTEEGQAAAEDFIQQRHRRHKEMFSCLSDDEKTNLLSLLEKINSDWKTRYPDSEPQLPYGRHPHRHPRTKER